MHLTVQRFKIIWKSPDICMIKRYFIPQPFYLWVKVEAGAISTPWDWNEALPQVLGPCNW